MSTPMKAMNAEKITKVAGIVQNEGIARSIIPTKIQLIRVNLTIPSH
jgi:hypothetical protein